MNRRALIMGMAAGCGTVAFGPRFPVGATPRPAGGSVGAAQPDALTHLPSALDEFAFTVDDGVDASVVAAFVAFSQATGTRLTFFVNGIHESWSANAATLRPLVESGQIQLANHTWSHPDVTALSAGEVAEEIGRNADFLRRIYGVDGTPFFRPPFGRHNAETDAVAADLGYSSVVLWSSSLEDWKPLDELTLMANAERSLAPGEIVLAHANLDPITRCFTEIDDLVHARGLEAVTLSDAFRTPSP